MPPTNIRPAHPNQGSCMHTIQPVFVEILLESWLLRFLTIFFALSFVLMISACSKSSTLEVKAKDMTTNVGQTASSESDYSPESDRYEVDVIESLELKTANDREIPLKIYVPKGTGPFPVVIFSHGTGASKDDYATLGEFWAAHGYVSIHPSHADSLALRGLPLNLRNLRTTLDEVLNDSNSWVERARDLELIVNTLPNLASYNERLSGKIDSSRVGVAGHSFGAYAAQIAGGASISLPDGRGSFRLPENSEIKATLLLSPQGTGQQGLTRESWRNFRQPMMVMTGPEDQGAEGQDYRWKTEPFELSPANSNKYLVLLAHANHFSFGGRAQAGIGRAQSNGGGEQTSEQTGGERDRPFLQRRQGEGRRERPFLQRRQERQQALEGGNSPLLQGRQGQEQRTLNYIKLASVAFWDTYLKSEPQAQDYLLEDLEATSDDEVSVSFR